MPRRHALLVAVALLAVVGAVLVVLGSAGTSTPPAPSARGPASIDRTTASPATIPSPIAARGPVQRPGSGSPPAALEIPAIGVGGPVNAVGLNPDGTLEVPAPGPFYDQAAWYRGSPTPGRVGPSVILGHVDSAAEGPSVFYELGRLRPGDRITVTLADGSRRDFTVHAVRAYPKNEFPRLDVYGDTAGPELRLITCGGDFDSAAGSYRDNTVVFARLA